MVITWFVVELQISKYSFKNYSIFSILVMHSAFGVELLFMCQARTRPEVSEGDPQERQ